MRPSSSPFRRFEISVRAGREGSVVVPVGELDLASADRLGETVAQESTRGATRLVVDLSEVDFIDSTGLRVLLSLRNDAKRNGHELTLVAPPPGVRRIFEITGTRGLFRWRTDHCSEEPPQQATGSAEHAPQQADDAGEQTSHHTRQSP